jgi:hypothetical protein
LEALLRAGLPPACQVTGHYDLKAIDAWLDARAGIGQYEGKPKRNVMDGLKERMDAMLNGSDNAEPWKPREYATGEWEEIIRGRELQKREKQSLGAYYRAKDSEPSILKGAGYATVERLIARGYIVSVDPNPDAFHPICKITREGCAAWLAIADRDGKNF